MDSAKDDRNVNSAQLLTVLEFISSSENLLHFLLVASSPNPKQNSHPYSRPFIGVILSFRTWSYTFYGLVLDGQHTDRLLMVFMDGIGCYAL